MKKEQQKQFSELLKKYEKALWRVTITYEANHSLREELFEDILLEVWKSVKRFEGKSSYKTYIYRVAHNVAFKYVSRQVKGKSTVSFSEELTLIMSLEKASIARQNSDGLSRAIRSLPLKQREVVSLYLEGLTYPEISEISGISTNNIGVILNRSKKQLKDIWEQT